MTCSPKANDSDGKHERLVEDSSERKMVKLCGACLKQYEAPAPLTCCGSILGWVSVLKSKA